MAMQQADAYDLFGLPADAPVEEIRREYRRLARSWHPDRLERAAPEIRTQATTYLQQLNTAYARLTSPNAQPSRAQRWEPAQAGSVQPPESQMGWSTTSHARS